MYVQQIGWHISSLDKDNFEMDCFNSPIQKLAQVEHMDFVDYIYYTLQK